jgi:hypothetical protein
MNYPEQALLNGLLANVESSVNLHEAVGILTRLIARPNLEYSSVHLKLQRLLGYCLRRIRLHGPNLTPRFRREWANVQWQLRNVAFAECLTASTTVPKCDQHHYEVAEDGHAVLVIYGITPQHQRTIKHWVPRTLPFDTMQYCPDLCIYSLSILRGRLRCCDEVWNAM